ncbi:hypothetical protein M406DRAFT_270266, partial [Cryphonectria parasitica EP155]
LQQISLVNYKLVLSYKIRIYSVFHILLLELEILADNIAEVKNNELEYKIEKILKHRNTNSTRKYLIK